jgi:hypothetical protein
MSSDPEELNDLYLQNPSMGAALRDELLAQIEAQDVKRRP